jgi:hypothetical protein
MDEQQNSLDRVAELIRWHLPDSSVRAARTRVERVLTAVAVEDQDQGTEQAV